MPLGIERDDHAIELVLLDGELFLRRATSTERQREQ